MKERKKAKEIIEKIKLDSRRHLMEHECKRILKAYSIPTTREKIATNVEDAVTSAEYIGFPVVLKICSPDIIHKTDIGGVIVNLKTQTEVRDAFKQINENVNKKNPQARVLGVLVQEMAPSGHEVIVGATRDKQFGPVVMFGLGGIFVEILGDVSFRLAPLSKGEALDMVKEIKGFRLLEGVRGSKPADLDALAETIIKVGRIMVDLQEIVEMDINPLKIYDKGLKAVDSRILLHQN